MQKAGDKVKVHMTIRDWSQSLHGTKVSAEHIVQATQNIKEYGVDSVQCAGGTFGQLLIRDDINPYQFVEKLTDHYEGIEKTMLNRNEVGLCISRQAPDVLEHILRRHAEVGVNRIDNFHHDNDPNMMRAIPFITRKLQEEGFAIRAQAGVTIQTNPDTMSRQDKIISQILKDTEEMLKQGHQGIYIKNANGVLSPDFTFAVVEALGQKFDEDTHFHTHNTFGYGYQNAVAAIVAGVDSMDGLPDALAEGTGQISLEKLDYQLKAQGVERQLGVNFEAMKKDEPSAYVVRTLYSDSELPFNKGLLKAAERAGSAGGAISSLPAVLDLAMLGKALNVSDPVEVQKIVYEQKEKNRSAFGFATNVTPSENIQDVQAYWDTYNKATKGSPAFSTLAIGTAQFMTGALGRVPDSVDKDIQKKVLEDSGMDRVSEFIPFEDMPAGMPSLKSALTDFGVPNPTDDEASFMALNSMEAASFVQRARAGLLSPIEPSFPMNLKDGGALADYRADIFAIVYKSLEVYKAEDGFYDGYDYQTLFDEGRILDVEQGDIDYVVNRNAMLNWGGYVRDKANELNDMLDALQDRLAQDDVGNAFPRQVNRSILALSLQLGVPSSAMRSVSLGEHPRSQLSEEWDEADSVYPQEYDEDESFDLVAGVEQQINPDVS